LWKRWTHSLMKWFISCSNVLYTFMAIKIKQCPSWNLLYLWILTMALSFAIAFVGQLMTFEATGSHVDE
jgi:Fe2+ transport system protein B